MAVNRTTLLDLPLPVTGTEASTWGDITNNGLTQYVDIAIAGTLDLSTDADVNLSLTEGNAAGTNIVSTTAQYMVLKCSGSRTVTRYINAPKQSKLYVVINDTTGGQSVVLRGGPTSPTTGVTVANGAKLLCAWNGSDFIPVGAVNIPQSGSAKTTSYTLATTDVGEFVEVGSGGSIEIPNATFSPGDAVLIFNNTSAGITITCTITTAYIGGTDADKATMTLATRGVASILFVSGTVCVVTGNVS